MKKNTSKILIILGVLIAIVTISLIIVTSLTTPDKDTTLTAIEKRWVDQNKNKVIDIAITNDIPVFSYEGEGVFYDYLDDFNKNIGLSFNTIPYVYGETPSLQDYNFEIVDSPNNNQLVFYQDNYVLLSKSKGRVDDLSSLKNIKIGMLERKLSKVKYLFDSLDVELNQYDKIDTLLSAFDNNEVNNIIVPYSLYMNKIIKDYKISYRFKDISDNYVITLSDKNDKVNNIMTKYLKLWLTNKYTEVYNKNYNNLYNEINGISSKTLAEFRNKDYVYGYVDNLPYESVVNNRLIGINGEYISKYSDLTKTNFKYKKYTTNNALINAFNKGEVDIIFNDMGIDKLSSGAYFTTSVFNEKYVILNNIMNTNYYESIKGIQNNKVFIKENSLLLKYVNSNSNAKVKTYNNINQLFDSIDENSIIIIDYNTYDYYKNNKFNKFKIAYSGTIEKQYTYAINNKSDNKVFIKSFDTYISGLNEKTMNNISLKNLIINPKNETLAEGILNYLLYYVIPIFSAVVILTFIFRKKKTKDAIKKDEKLRYIDHLTSLKNRNYLNSKIKEWDETKVYPQTIIIVDLNNVKYINDNFGHEEGDSTIKAAANILINTQKENSDIIRTDGNEFLIYLIGYSEDEMISYMKLLYKEFKDLPHGKGASLGYSIISDDLKLVGDAINEATLDMRTNKES